MDDRQSEAKEEIEYLAETPPWQWPADAGETLLAAVNDRGMEEADRLLAAELAGDAAVINDKLAGALLSVLNDESEPEGLRGQAAVSFGPALELADIDGFDDLDTVAISESMFRRIQEALHRVYVDASAPVFARRRALEASVRAREDWHQDAVRAAYACDTKDWKLTAVFCMQFVRGFDEQIMEALDSTDPEIVYEAVRAAGASELSEAWPYIVDILQSEPDDKELFLAAIEASVGVNPSEAPEILVDFMEASDDDIADAASEAYVLAESYSEMLDEDEDEYEDDEEDGDESF